LSSLRASGAPATLPRGEGSSAIGEFKVCSLPTLVKSVFVIFFCGVPPLPSGEGARGRGSWEERDYKWRGAGAPMRGGRLGR